jgi:pilus assembly protein Flp/PilA
MLTNLQFLTNWIRARFGEDDRGASLVEYALLVALIAVVCIVAVTTLGTEAKKGFESTGTAIAGANSAN